MRLSSQLLAHQSMNKCKFEDCETKLEYFPRNHIALLELRKQSRNFAACVELHPGLDPWGSEILYPEGQGGNIVKVQHKFTIPDTQHFRAHYRHKHAPQVTNHSRN